MSPSPARQPPRKRRRCKSRPSPPAPRARSRSRSSSSLSSSSSSSKLTPAQIWWRALVAEHGVEDPGANQHVYLASVSRVLPETLAATDLCDITVITRQQIGEMFLDAVNNPAIQGAGRPRKDDVGRVEKIVVFKELHEDGTPHFRVAIKLRGNMRFAAVKKTLRSRHKLPSHWSCSHR